MGLYDPVMAQELWKPITGYENSYAISNQGRVKSLLRRIVRTNGRPQTIPERILKPSRPGGYCQVQLWSGNSFEARYVHCLVMEEFVGPAPKGHEVNHKDGSLTNNCLSNLEYLTHSDNMLHAVHSIRTVTPPLNLHLQRKQYESAKRIHRPRKRATPDLH